MRGAGEACVIYGAALLTQSPHVSYTTVNTEHTTAIFFSLRGVTFAEIYMDDIPASAAAKAAVSIAAERRAPSDLRAISYL